MEDGQALTFNIDCDSRFYYLPFCGCASVFSMQDIYLRIITKYQWYANPMNETIARGKRPSTSSLVAKARNSHSSF